MAGMGSGSGTEQQHTNSVSQSQSQSQQHTNSTNSLLPTLNKDGEIVDEEEDLDDEEEDLDGRPGRSRTHTGASSAHMDFSNRYQGAKGQNVDPTAAQSFDAWYKANFENESQILLDVAKQVRSGCWAEPLYSSRDGFSVPDTFYLPCHIRPHRCST